MAKLSARGRYQILEVSREVDEATLQKRTDKSNEACYPNGCKDDGTPIAECIRLSLTVWERHTLRLMSDGTLLEKLDVRFRPSNPPVSWEPPEGRYHSYGWKVKGKIKAGLTVGQFYQVYTGTRPDGTPARWSGTPPSEQEASRILRPAV